MKLRPLWENASMNGLRDWQVYSADLLRFLSTGGLSPVIGLGHSIGGTVTLRAALRDPAQFRALVLFDPVLFTYRRMIAWNIARALGLGYKLHPKISGALKRRRTFDDLDVLFRGYRSRPVFQYMNDESLRCFINGITKPSPNGGYELAYSPEWEVHIYHTGLLDFDIWAALPNLQVPTLIIRGAETDTFLENASQLVTKKNPKIKIVTLERTTHILPLEDPQGVFAILDEFLANLSN
jgi:pimeloyl-ACP methyl ester carboxylesterase